MRGNLLHIRRVIVCNVVALTEPLLRSAARGMRQSSQDLYVDVAIDHVALGGHAIKDFADMICELTPSGAEVEDLMVYEAAAVAASKFDGNWCDLCELLALHAHGSNIPATDPDIRCSVTGQCYKLPATLPIRCSTLDSWRVYGDEHSFCDRRGHMCGPPVHVYDYHPILCWLRCCGR